YKNLNSTIPQMDRVLIVDDDLMIKVMLEDILHAHGYQTYHASNGREAVRLVKEHTPEIILMDIIMPEMDGIAACKAIRSATTLPIRPSIIMVSNKSDKDAIIEALEKGADDFITKPVDNMELIARIHAQSRTRGFYREIYEDKKNLEMILDVTKTISSMLKTEEVLYTIVKRVADITGAVRCSIVLISKEDIGYVLASHESPTIKEIKLDLNKYPEIREALKSKRPVVIEDISRHPLMAEVKDLVKDLDRMNVLVLPIIWEEEVIGTLFLRTRRLGKGFTEKDINLCQIIAQSAYHAIKNARLFEEVSKEKEEMKTLAITDSLTEVYNHNFFYTRLEEEFNRTVRYETPISLIMMDIDDFKRINDTYGHRTGDHVLKEVADMIKKLVRKTDIVARYGGEEFSVILPHTNLLGAEEEAERIREAISSHAYANLTKETITISLGVVSYPSGKTIMNAGDFVNLADTALYEAKRSGKNKVVVLGRK
ncbi:MAG TPA: diguanylate cyclase, partial [Thermodesulfobacteriota bacterium]|nr:diguanylate cyclase [Thermodesulfobacteriota bacterium]